MKKRFSVILLVALTSLSVALLAACSSGAKSTPTKPAAAVTTRTEHIKQAENKYKDYTAQQFYDITEQGWFDLAASAGIMYELTGSYTEAYANQIWPTYFDVYMLKDGSVVATYNADYAASWYGTSAQGTWANGSGDGHADKEYWFGYWYDDTLGNWPIIQWVGYADYKSGHVLTNSTTSACMDGSGSGSELTAAWSMPYNGNSRTCMFAGNTYSPYKPDTLNVDVSKVEKDIKVGEYIHTPDLVITCQREDGKTATIGSYMFDYSYDNAGNVTMVCPLLGLKDTTSLKLNPTATVYNTKISKGGEMVDATITRDNSETAVLEADGKKARFSYKIEFYRNVFTVGDFVEDSTLTPAMTADEFAAFTTKYYFVGNVTRSLVADVVTDAVNSDFEGDHLVPETGHYATVPNGDPITAPEGETVAVADGKQYIHVEPNKGPGVFSQGYQFITFEDTTTYDGQEVTIPFAMFRFFVSTNAEYINCKALINTLDLNTGELLLAYTENTNADTGAKTLSLAYTKYGNNISTRTTCYAYTVNPSDGTITLAKQAITTP
jgi:hypothetical protein